MLYLFCTEDCLMWFHIRYIMLYCFCTEESVLCDSIESVDYAIFVSYRSSCLMWFYRVKSLGFICFVQKSLSYVIPSSQ